MYKFFQFSEHHYLPNGQNCYLLIQLFGVVVAATGGLATGAVLAALPAMGGLGTAMVSGAVAGAIGGASYGAISSGL